MSTQDFHDDSATEVASFGDWQGLNTGNTFTADVGTTGNFWFNAGDVGFNNTNPTHTIDDSGDFHLVGCYYDTGNNCGANGNVLVSTGSATNWQSTTTAFKQINIETAAIGGAIVGVGCDSADTSVSQTIASTTGFTTTPEVFPGSGVFAYSMALTTSKIRTFVCSDVTVTPNASKYIVKILL